jgi:hypothetical protein
MIAQDRVARLGLTVRGADPVQAEAKPWKHGVEGTEPVRGNRGSCTLVTPPQDALSVGVNERIWCADDTASWIAGS